MSVKRTKTKEKIRRRLADMALVGIPFVALWLLAIFLNSSIFGLLAILWGASALATIISVKSAAGRWFSSGNVHQIYEGPIGLSDEHSKSRKRS
jgi:hypothetical protein